MPLEELAAVSNILVQIVDILQACNAGWRRRGAGGVLPFPL